MKNEEFRDINLFISRDLLNPLFIKKSGFHPEPFKKLINSASLKNHIRKIYSNNNFSCTEALNLALDIMKGYCRENMDSWLFSSEEKALKDILYNYNQGLLYPHTLEKRYSGSVRDIYFLRFYSLYTRILKTFIINAKLNPGNGWEYNYPYCGLEPEEYKDSRFKKEYEQFAEVFSRQNVYGLMKMSQEWKGYTSLDHTLGVYSLCMFIGLQMKNLGFPVDLAILSGASIGHDIGKYGCVGEELKQIAYYHYFYTKEWYDRNGLYNLSHYATNHSTWDLEELRLPNETIILIYSDFRVKSRTCPDGTSKMDIYSNKESFEVIRDKLDNLDEKKLDRYKRVYKKLEDLERMFVSLGINTDVENGIKLKDYGQKHSRFNALCIVNGKVNSDFIGILPNNQIINSAKILTVAHNIFVMDKMRDSFSLKKLFEDARQEKTKSDLRIYLSIIEAYSDFFTLEQRELCIDFLFDMLNHPDDDIRYHSADTIGKFVAEMKEAYTRYLPPGKSHMIIDKSDKYLQRLFALLDFVEPSDPEGYLTEKKLYNTTIAVRKLLKTAREEKQEDFGTRITDMILGRGVNARSLALLYLTEIISDASGNISDENLLRTIPLLISNLSHKDRRIRLMTLRALLNFSKRDLWKKVRDEIILDFSDLMESILNFEDNPTETYSIYFLFSLLDRRTASLLKKRIQPSNLARVADILDSVDIRPVFLKNLKTSTPWTEKKINCQMLVDIAQRIKEKDPESSLIIDIAIHLGNILKVSQYEGTRFQAGSSLLELSRMLNHTQLNEISIELLRTLEQESLGFTHYIPRVLGQIIARLPMAEFQEIYDDIKEKIKTGSPPLKELYLKTLSIIITHLDNEMHGIYGSDMKILGLFTGSLCDINKYTKQKAHYIIGSRIFGSRFLSMEEKKKILCSSLKKILSLISNTPDDYIDLFYSATLLNNIYIFISNYEFDHGILDMPEDKPAAFFPGTFDPFSLSHLEIVKSCQKEGFEVFIQVDEFSWRKRTLPPAIRKNIIRLSVSHLLNCFVYPEIPPINLANDSDLDRLINTFSDRELYLVAGADVIANASAYVSGSAQKIKELNHYIVFRKDPRGQDIHENPQFKRIIDSIKGNIILRELDDVFNYINSTKIRNLIDRDEPITHLVDARSAFYINSNNLYIRQPEEKQSIELWDFEVEIVSIRGNPRILDKLPENITGEIMARKKRYNISFDKFIKDLSKKDSSLFIIKRASHSREYIGAAIFYTISEEGIFDIIRDPAVSKFQRNNTFGKIAYIDSSYIKKESHIFFKSRFHLFLIREGYLFALQETDMSLLKENSDSARIEKMEYTYNKIMGYSQMPQEFRRKGFPMKMNLIDLRKPVIFINNLEDVLKSPYSTYKTIKNRIRKNRENLLRILSRMNRENAIISLDHRDIVFNIMKKISDLNLQDPQNPYLCILYGNILGKYIIPGTISKALHAERAVNSEGKLIGFTHSKHYYSIPVQLKTIRAFGKRTILSDIIVHSARRILNIHKSAREVGVEIKKVVSGIVSGLAKEIMDANSIPSESVFHIPRLHSWYEEHMMYPFAGGDSIIDYMDLEEPLNRSMLYLLPFCPYEMQKNVSINNRIVFSQCALENAWALFKDIEEIYLDTKKKNLILQNVQEVLENPRIPVYNPLYIPGKQEMLSKLIEKDIDTLKRFYTIA